MQEATKNQRLDEITWLLVVLTLSLRQLLVL